MNAMVSDLPLCVRTQRQVPVFCYHQRRPSILGCGSYLIPQGTMLEVLDRWPREGMQTAWRCRCTQCQTGLIYLHILLAETVSAHEQLEFLRQREKPEVQP